MEYALDQFLLQEAQQAEAEDHGFDSWAEYQVSITNDKADAYYEATRMEELGL